MEILTIIGTVLDGAERLVDKCTTTSITKEKMKQDGENFRTKLVDNGETKRYSTGCATAVLITGMIGGVMLIKGKMLSNSSKNELIEEANNENGQDAE